MPVPSGPGREAVGTFWVSALPPDVICGRAGAVGFPTSPALPSSHSSLGLAGLQVRTSLPQESTQDPVSPHCCLEKWQPRVVGNGGQPNAETKITQREKQEEPKK